MIGYTRKNLSKKFCRCIKQVSSYIKPNKGTKESASIAICVKSVLQTRGRTLKKFKCGKNRFLKTQKLALTTHHNDL
jgi:hypothetical protein